MKKWVAALLCAALAVVLLPMGAAAAGEAPVEIWNRAQLEAIAEDPAGQYILMEDIDLGDAPWVPLAFSGSLDGAGHTLYNLTIRQADPQTAVSVDGNHKEYDTEFAALFSRTENATIRALNILGADVQVDTGQNAFAAILVGWAENTVLEGCSVQGRVALRTGGRMCGVAGLVGFGWGTATRCTVNAELTLVDTNETENCEEFLGGILASGYMDIDGCTVALEGYTSVHGYVHNGGVVGMYYVHTEDTSHAGYVRGCTVDATIHFFEHVASRRAYCSPVIGEQMHWILEIADNETLHFESDETTDYSVALLPEACADPATTAAVSPPGCDAFGFTTHRCDGCGYQYTANYTAPAHQPGEWVMVDVGADITGLEQRLCTLCGQVAEERTVIAVTDCRLDTASLTLENGKSARLTATVLPEDATDKSLVFLSSDPGVATVDETGHVVAVGPGSAVITCAVAGGAVAATCEVTVPAPPGGSIWPLVAVIATGVAVVAVVVALLLNRRKKRRRQRRRYRF